MRNISTDLVIVGGGPAGLAAAVEAHKQGIKNIFLLERDKELGGILQQCIHDGFGLLRFGKQLSGCQYAQRFIDELAGMDITVKLETMVLEITPEKKIFACNPVDGILEIDTKTIILAMGCRERTQAQVFLQGSRPAGVMTAGSAQRYINMEGYLPGKTAVVFGSGDIGLIMARRMALEGIEVKGVYARGSVPGGLTRNIVQCLEDYNIPLHLSTAVTEVHGKNALESVTIVKTDERKKPIPGTEEIIECDLLILAVGLIPENELSLHAGIELDANTKGPVVDENFMTNIPGVFAAGNVSTVFDLVDYVSMSGEIAARGAAKYLKGEISADTGYRNVEAGNNISFVVPQKIHVDAKLDKHPFFMRVKKPQNNVRLECICNGNVVAKARHQIVTPPEMLSCMVSCSEDGALCFGIKEV